MKKCFLLIYTFLLIYSCNENPVSGNPYEYEVIESQTLNISTQTKLIVVNTNGSITITSSDTTNSIHFNIIKKVRSGESINDAQSHIEAINVSIEENVNDITVNVNHPMSDDRDYEITFNIILPNDFNYEIALGNGNIAVTSITKVLILNLGNGNVVSNVTLQDTCAVSVAVGNGNIILTIPDSTNALLNASVGNGNITNSGLTFQNQQFTNNQFSGTLGNGAGSIALSIGNGNIELIKK